MSDYKEVIEAAVFPQFGFRDWAEDAYADSDNGCYQHTCEECHLHFFGHKRRGRMCKGCWIKWAEKFIPEARAELTSLRQTVERWERLEARADLIKFPLPTHETHFTSVYRHGDKWEAPRVDGQFDSALAAFESITAEEGK